jgi:hypothetical protein
MGERPTFSQPSFYELWLKKQSVWSLLWRVQSAMNAIILLKKIAATTRTGLS